MLDSLSFPRFRVLIDIFLLCSLIFLAFASLFLSRHFDSLVLLPCKPLRSFSKGRNGFYQDLTCSCCSSKDKSCIDLPSKNIRLTNVEELQVEAGKLKEEIARERHLGEEAVEHLEDERHTSHTAVNEMMIKLMLLLKEKGLVEMEA